MQRKSLAHLYISAFLFSALSGVLLVSNTQAGAAPFYSESPETTQDVREALRICENIASTPPEQRTTRLRHGRLLAERAVARSPRDPRAQFALFCSLGRHLERQKSLRAVFLLRKARDAVQEALSLQPTYIDALVAQGAMLGQLPWLMGGNVDRAESLLRKAIALDPTFLPAHRELSRLLQAHGRSDEAFAFDVAQALP